MTTLGVVSCVDTFDPEDLQGEQVIRYVFSNSEFAHLTDLVVAQCKFESYGFASSLYKSTRNFSGMGIAYKRNQLRSGINPKGEYGRPTAIYRSDYQAALDLLDWYTFHGTYFCGEVTSNEFVRKLKRKRYFGIYYSRYLGGVNRYLEDKEDLAPWLEVNGGGQTIS
jgi:hypothetical protein